jgi:hypothetical protein
VTASLLAGLGGEATARTSTVCGLRHAHLLEASSTVLLAKGGNLYSSMFACLRGTRQIVVIGPVIVPRAATRGVFNVQLRGPLIAYQVVGKGCADGDCLGPAAEVVDLRTRRHRNYYAAVDIALGSHGDVVTVETSATAAFDDDGSAVGPGPFRIVWYHDEIRTVLAGGDGIDPHSLALGNGRVYWVQSGVPASATTRA